MWLAWCNMADIDNLMNFDFEMYKGFVACLMTFKKEWMAKWHWFELATIFRSFIDFLRISSKLVIFIGNNGFLKHFSLWAKKLLNPIFLKEQHELSTFLHLKTKALKIKLNFILI